MSVLLVKRAALGDVLRTTSLLPAVRRRWGGPVWWITDPAAKPLLEKNPLIDRVLVSGEGLDRRFDLALSLEEDLDCARWAASAGATLVGVTAHEGGKLGYTHSAEDYYGMSLLGPDRAEADRRKAANRRSFAALWHGILGLKTPAAPGPSLRLTAAERAAGARELGRLKLSRRPFALNAGAGGRWPSKQLGERPAAALARAMTALGPVVLLGGREEEARNARIAREAGAGVFVQRPVPLRLFAAVVERTAGVVTTDTLAVHVAAALRRPTVALVGPTSSAELDLGPRGAVLAPKSGCACFYAANCRRLTHCLEDIPPARIVSTLRRLAK